MPTATSSHTRPPSISTRAPSAGAASTPARRWRIDRVTDVTRPDRPGSIRSTPGTAVAACTAIAATTTSRTPDSTGTAGTGGAAPRELAGRPGDGVDGEVSVVTTVRILLVTPAG